jgi:NodT family efflux transporter outer membrane factor (OMF) lipoprotein
MMHKTPLMLGSALFCLTHLAGCAVSGPPRQEAAIPLPLAWQEAPAAANISAPAAAAAVTGAASRTPSDLPAETTANIPVSPADNAWWGRFGSPELAALVARVLGENLDVAQATARVAQAEAAARVVGGARLPQLEGVLGRSREGNLGSGSGASGNRTNVGLEARYEVDWWGRTRHLEAGALAELAASRHARDTMALAMTARVAQAWLAQVALAERQRLAEASLELAQRLERLVQARVQAGAATPLDLSLQRGLVAAQHGRLALVRQQVAENRYRLAALLGGASVAVGTSLDDLQVPGVEAGLPAALLLRRPDIAEAEARLAAADGQLLAARAALLPRLDLSAGLGAAAGGASGLFDNPVYSLAAALVAPLFNGGRLAGLRDQAEALREERRQAYRQTLINALADVETALAANTGLEARLAAATAELQQAEQAATLADARYRAGAESLLTLLESQRSLYNSRDQWAQLRLGQLQGAVDLFRALGGGWQLPSAAAVGGEAGAAPQAGMDAGERAGRPG